MLQLVNNIPSSARFFLLDIHGGRLIICPQFEFRLNLCAMRITKTHVEAVLASILSRKCQFSMISSIAFPGNSRLTTTLPVPLLPDQTPSVKVVHFLNPSPTASVATFELNTTFIRKSASSRGGGSDNPGCSWLMISADSLDGTLLSLFSCQHQTPLNTVRKSNVPVLGLLGFLPLALFPFLLDCCPLRMSALAIVHKTPTQFDLHRYAFVQDL